MRDIVALSMPGLLGFPKTAGLRNWILIVLGVVAAVLGGCSGPGPQSDPPYLLRVGPDVVTVLDYEKAVELAKAAYPRSALEDPKTEHAIKLRVLREMTEDLVLRQRARELGITVSDAEVEKAEKRIRSDYPDGVFEETLLENAVSYTAWKEKLRSRLLAEKLIAQDLESHIQISARDVAAYYAAHRGELAEDPDEDGDSPLPKAVDERIVRDLKRKKAEEAYTGWMDSLQDKYLIDINVAQWQRISES